MEEVSAGTRGPHGESEDGVAYLLDGALGEEVFRAVVDGAVGRSRGCRH